MKSRLAREQTYLLASKARTEVRDHPRACLPNVRRRVSQPQIGDDRLAVLVIRQHKSASERLQAARRCSRLQNPPNVRQDASLTKAIACKCIKRHAEQWSRRTQESRLNTVPSLTEAVARGRREAIRDFGPLNPPQRRADDFASLAVTSRRAVPP